MWTSYPPSRRDDFVETLHGQSIPDPYRWLEDISSPDSAAWVKAQSEFTEQILAGIPQRNGIRKHLTDLWNYEKFGVPLKRGGRYFFTRNNGLQNQSVLYWMPSLAAQPVELLDPNQLSPDGTVALSGYAISRDGQYLAYSLSSAGSDWQEWRVRQVDNGKDLPDVVKWAKFTGASWSVDNRGFYYSRYDAPEEGGALKDINFFHKLYYHRIGTDQAEDRLVYQRSDHKEWGITGQASQDGRYLIISVWEGTREENGLFYLDLRRPDAPVVELYSDFDAIVNPIGNNEDRLFLLTNQGAPLRQVVAVDLSQPGSWEVLVPEAADSLENASIVGDRIFCNYLHDAHSLVKEYDLSGRPVSEVTLPGLGSAGGFEGTRQDQETFYIYTCFTTPDEVYRYDLTTGKSRLLFRPKLAFRPEDYITEQVFYPSKDGTRIPMFITYKKGLSKNGSNPALLYGYGGFSIPMTPYFSTTMLGWMEMGGIYAFACLRGGSEYGKAWHEAGMKHNKQNVFDDFIAAAEWLIRSGYTSTPKLAIMGGSNGGLLVGAVMTQRPELFGAAVPEVGVMDRLRFHKFTIGWAWTSDYGSPDDPDDFPYLLAYSPYHQIEPGRACPPTLVITADHDDRVFPAHSFKFAAALQHAQASEAPALIRIEVRAGHGMGKPTSKMIEESADILAFLVKELNIM